ncbi:MAG: TolC family protein [Bacteroidales bacterium]|jgi:outer membrane protein TolC|nr:TolC family protein [Bacteroidales bacterium]
MIKRLLILTPFLFLTGVSLQSQNRHLYKLQADTSSEKTYSLSLQKAIDYAQANNKNLQQIKNNTLKAFYGKWEAAGNYLPQASGTVEYSNSLEGDLITPFGSLPSGSGTVGLQATQVVFNGNAIVGIMLGKIGQKIAELNEENQILALKAAVSQAYYAVLLSEETRKILVQNITFMRDLSEKTKALADGGVMEQTDADQMQVQVNLIENLLKDADRNNTLAYNSLKIQMGLRSEDKVVLTDNLDDMIVSKNNLEIAATPYNIDADLQYMMLKENEEVSKKQRLMSVMNFLPTVAGFYKYTYNMVSSPMNDIMSRPHLAGIQVNIPIFSTPNIYKYKQANIDYQNARLNSDLMHDQMLIKEQQLRFNFRTALEQYETQKLNSSVATRVLGSIQLKYTAGVKSAMEMTTANSDYLRAQTDYLTAVAKVLQARADLEQLLGM